MKKFLLISLLSSYSVLVFAQPSVYTKTKKVEIKDPITTSEIFASVEVDKKLVEDAWREQLTHYGRLLSTRGSLVVDPAYISSISSEPLVITSKVTASRGWTTIFMTIQLANGETIHGTHPKYGAAEKVLSGFLEKTQRLEEMYKAESELNQTDKKVQSDQALMMQMQKDLEANRKEYDEAKKKIETLDEELKQIKAAIAKHDEDKKKTVSTRENLRTKVLESRQKMQR